MSLSTLKTPVLSKITKRGYATKTLAQSIKGTVIQTKKLPNSTLVVAAPDFPTKIGRISVTFLAGSRYEDPESTGISNLIRSSAGLSTSASTTFSILRNLGHLGANYSVSSDRETITYTIEAHKENLTAGLKYFIESVSQQTFKPWELSDNQERVEYELLLIPPELRALDLAHKAAYRNTLGNTIYLPKYNLKKLGSEHLLFYVKKNFTSDKAIISSVGVDAETLQLVSEDLNLPKSEQDCSVKAKYYGGDVRKAKDLGTSYLAVVGEGVSYGNSQSAAFAVLEYLLGKGSSVKWGVGQGNLEQNILQSNVSGNFAVSAINYNYSDSGLFGFLLAYNGKDSGKALNAAVQSLKSPKITDAEVSRAKKQLLFSLLSTSESSSELLKNITNQAVVTGKVHPIEKLVAAVESVSIEDVKKAASQVANSKLSLGGYGNIVSTPYLDSL
ncbi:cytochrome b-c1 complex subunit 2, mitochondrial-like [Daktulosphaira vitifoliae]|uniref:cytochrome b-c1 complex subunit 2, mitochondrial-like n=1 Tax=Daktulosphaira vitifoliae TaxID=58002 RepID=UPI0021AA44E5|nr:cytochrome b-c1 complex subunit 2, mitochondrial-like [Daktulosphaira vitifoliae]